jgi:hypothetical protein
MPILYVSTPQMVHPLLVDETHDPLYPAAQTQATCPCRPEVVEPVLQDTHAVPSDEKVSAGQIWQPALAVVQVPENPGAQTHAVWLTAPLVVLPVAH